MPTRLKTKTKTKALRGFSGCCVYLLELSSFYVSELKADIVQSKDDGTPGSWGVRHARSIAASSGRGWERMNRHLEEGDTAS